MNIILRLCARGRWGALLAPLVLLATLAFPVKAAAASDGVTSFGPSPADYCAEIEALAFDNNLAITQELFPAMADDPCTAQVNAELAAEFTLETRQAANFGELVRQIAAKHGKSRGAEAAYARSLFTSRAIYHLGHYGSCWGSDRNGRVFIMERTRVNSHAGNPAGRAAVRSRWPAGDEAMGLPEYLQVCA